MSSRVIAAIGTNRLGLVADRASRRSAVVLERARAAIPLRHVGCTVDLRVRATSFRATNAAATMQRRWRGALSKIKVIVLSRIFSLLY